MMTGKSILTRSSVLAQVESTGAINRADLKIAAIANSTSATFAQENTPEAELTTTATSDEAVALLIAGKVDAVLADHGGLQIGPCCATLNQAWLPSKRH